MGLAYGETGRRPSSPLWEASRSRHNGRVDYLATGEWVTSNLLFSAAFLAAGLGIVGIAGWVLRADRINRAAIDVDADDEQTGH
jgi:hypothetical protein